MNINNLEKYIIPVGVVAAIVYFGNKIFNSMNRNVIEDKDYLTTLDTSTDEQRDKFDLITRYNYHHEVGSKLSDNDAKNIAAMFNSALGFFNDDENMLVATARQIESVADFSKVNEMYYNEYGKNLVTMLEEELGGKNYDQYGKVLNDYVFNLKYK